MVSLYLLPFYQQVKKVKLFFPGLDRDEAVDLGFGFVLGVGGLWSPGGLALQKGLVAFPF